MCDISAIYIENLDFRVRWRGDGYRGIEGVGVGGNRETCWQGLSFLNAVAATINLNWRVSVGGCAIAELTTIIISPSPHGAVSLKGEGVLTASGDVDEVALRQRRAREGKNCDNK